MHISEGVLNAQTLIAGSALAAAGVAIGLRSIKQKQIPKVGLMTAAFFAASLIHVPVGPFNMHLVGNGLVGVILGWAAFPSIFVALTLQALLFGFGGLTTLGVNTLIMALPGVVVHYGYRAFANSSRPAMRNAAAFGTGFIAVFLSSAGLAMTLASTGKPFYLLAKVSFGAHFPMMFVEGAISFFVIGFLRKVKPEMLDTTPIFAKRK